MCTTCALGCFVNVDRKRIDAISNRIIEIPEAENDPIPALEELAAEFRLSR